MWDDVRSTMTVVGVMRVSVRAATRTQGPDGVFNRSTSRARGAGRFRQASDRQGVKAGTVTAR